MISYQRRFVITMKNVDEVSDGQHTCSHKHTLHQVIIMKQEAAHLYMINAGKWLKVLNREVTDCSVRWF